MPMSDHRFVVAGDWPPPGNIRASTAHMTDSSPMLLTWRSGSGTPAGSGCPKGLSQQVGIPAPAAPATSLVAESPTGHW